MHVDRHRAERLGGVEQQRHPGGDQRGNVGDLAADPRHVRAGYEPRRARDLAGELGEGDDADLDPVAPAGPPERREQAGMLLVGGDDLVAGAQIETPDHGVDAVGRRARQRDLGRVTAERVGVAGAGLGGERHQLFEVRPPAAAAIGLGLDPATDRVRGGARNRAFGSGVQVREPLEHRELGAEGGRVGGGGRRFVHTRILSSRMCFDFDARPPAPPEDLLLAPIAGGAGAEVLELTSADGTHFSAALAESASDRGAGVLIFPDVRGLYPFYSELAERFAQAGYHAIAMDYFGRTAGLGPRDEEFEYMPHVQQLTVPGVQQDAAAAIDALRERTGAGKIATVGFCLGGFESFLAGADMPDLAAVIGFYGVLTGSRFGVDGPLERAGDIKVPLLGLFGGADQGIPVEQVEEFDAKLTDAGLDHEIHVYPGAPHSFFDRRYEDYAEACEDAWRRMLGFLESHTG